MTTFSNAGSAVFLCNPSEGLFDPLVRGKLYLVHKIVESLLVVGAFDFAEHSFNGVQFRTVANI